MPCLIASQVCSKSSSQLRPTPSLLAPPASGHWRRRSNASGAKQVRTEATWDQTAASSPHLLLGHPTSDQGIEEFLKQGQSHCETPKLQTLSGATWPFLLASEMRHWPPLTEPDRSQCLMSHRCLEHKGNLGPPAIVLQWAWGETILPIATNFYSKLRQ